MTEPGGSAPYEVTDEYPEDEVSEDAADDEGDDEEAEVQAALGEGRTSAPLTDGSGFLILAGPASGAVVTRDDDSQPVAAVAVVPTRDEALSGDRPLIIVHRPTKFHTATPRLLANIHAAFGGNLAIGVGSRLASFSEQSHTDFHAKCGAAAVRIVDPEGCYVGTGDDLTLKTPSPRRLGRAPHLAGNQISIADYLDVQRQRGANLLLTPGRNFDRADAQPCLDAICADGDDALAALQPRERLALNLPISGHWLKNTALRSALLGQLIDQQQFDLWYVRVQLPTSVRSETQTVDENLLRGYRRLAELAVDEERTLIAAQSGLTGWFMLGFGAAGFGTGQSGPEQAFRDETEGGGGGGGPIERYFERQLLHTIERTARPIVTADPNYIDCDCPYCPMLRRQGVAWSHEYAGLHQVYNAGRLTASVNPTVPSPGGWYGEVRRTVRAAVAFADGKPLTGLSEPRHLQVWDRVL